MRAELEELRAEVARLGAVVAALAPQHGEGCERETHLWATQTS